MWTQFGAPLRHSPHPSRSVGLHFSISSSFPLWVLLNRGTAQIFFLVLYEVHESLCASFLLQRWGKVCSFKCVTRVSFTFLDFPERLNSALVWFYCSKWDHSASLSLLVRKQTFTSVEYNCCRRAIHTCPHASILPGGTQVLLRYLSFPLCHARRREGMWWVAAVLVPSRGFPLLRPFIEGLPTAVLLKHFLKINLFFFLYSLGFDINMLFL